MSEPGDVPPEILDRLRPLCLGLPETYEELAWVGVRWRVRKRTFAHVLTRDDGVCVMTFRSPPDEIGGLVASGPPFFKAGWGVDVVGLVFGDAVDWAEVAELLTESYRVLAPKKLAALLPG